MADIVHAMVILSGAVLVGAGTIADASRASAGEGCAAVGAVIFIIGLIGSGYVRFLWGAIVRWLKGPAKNKE